MTDSKQGTGQPGADEKVTDDLSAALGHLRDAVDRLRTEIESNAREEWVKAKPELKSTLGDLQKMIDAAAERAKIVLGDLSTRLDNEEKKDDTA